VATEEQLAAQLILELAQGPIDVALLNRPSDLYRPLADVDLVLPSLRREDLEEIVRTAARLDLHPLILRKSDVGNVTFILISGDLECSVHLDLLGDPSGSNRFGIRTPSLVASANRVGGAISSVSEIDRQIYRLSKSVVKRDRDRWQAASSWLASLGRSRVEARIKELLHPRTSRALLGHLKRQLSEPPRRQPTSLLGWATRTWIRYSPTGVVLQVRGTEQEIALLERLLVQHVHASATADSTRAMLRLSTLRVIMSGGIVLRYRGRQTGHAQPLFDAEIRKRVIDQLAIVCHSRIEPRRRPLPSTRSIFGRGA
jgi:hypothetical protein